LDASLEEAIQEDLRLTLFVARDVFLTPRGELSEFIPARHGGTLEKYGATDKRGNFDTSPYSNGFPSPPQDGCPKSRNRFAKRGPRSRRRGNKLLMVLEKKVATDKTPAK
jgi:hypothetical protein